MHVPGIDVTFHHKINEQIQNKFKIKFSEKECWLFAGLDFSPNNIIARLHEYHQILLKHNFEEDIFSFISFLPQSALRKIFTQTLPFKKIKLQSTKLYFKEHFFLHYDYCFFKFD